MPNERNIDAPITLVGSGRSGTTLLLRAFGQHPDIGITGETTNLIFDVWESVAATTILLPPLWRDGVAASVDERAALAVRQVLLTLCPDARPRWFQKPLGIPKALNARFGKGDRWSESAAWFWRRLQRTFPHARYFTVLRHPCDVVLSGAAYWGHDQATLWRSAGWMAYLLGHPESLVKQAIFYDDLVTDPEATLRRLFSDLDLPFDACVLRAFSQVHAPSQGRSRLDQLSVTRRAEWDQLNPNYARAEYVQPHLALFRRFGRELELPAPFDRLQAAAAPAPAAAPNTTAAAAAQDEVRDLVAGLNGQIEALHLDYRRRLHEALLENHAQSLEAARIWREQQAALRQLQDDKAWLDRQAAAWHTEAEQRGQAIADLQAWVAELEKAKAWWEQQAYRWQAQAQRRVPATARLQEEE
jgi:hypothetical protein